MRVAEKLAVIGDPIGHSLSPAMHSAALAAARLPWVYESRHVLAADLAETITGFRNDVYRGFNVTIPHKMAVQQYLDGVDDVAHAVGAVNTVVREGKRLVGYNTDPEGFRESLRSYHFDPVGASVVLFGAGGAAHAVVRALQAEAGNIVIVNRNREKAEALAARVGRDVTVLVGADRTVIERVARADLVVNATPLGMEHLRDQSPLPLGGCLRAGAMVMDLVYGRETPFLLSAREQGCCTCDGLEMLVQQGAAAFRMWTGLDPQLQVMREACQPTVELQPC